jgi:hypothetical protein
VLRLQCWRIHENARPNHGHYPEPLFSHNACMSELSKAGLGVVLGGLARSIVVAPRKLVRAMQGAMGNTQPMASSKWMVDTQEPVHSS